MPPKVGSRRATASTNASDFHLGHLDVEHVDAGEFLEENGLALHDRLGGQRTDVAKTKHSGAVGITPDEIAARRQARDGGRIARDLLAGMRDAGRVGQRQVGLIGQRLGRRDGDLPGRIGLVVVDRHPPTSVSGICDAPCQNQKSRPLSHLDHQLSEMARSFHGV